MRLTARSRLLETITPSGNHKSIFTGIAITTLIGAVSMSMPVLGFFCFLMLPLPILTYRLRLSRKPSAIVAFGAWGCLLFMNGGLSADLFLIAGMFSLGFLMGEGFWGGHPVDKTIAVACLAVLFGGVFGLVLYGNIVNQNLLSLISGYIDKNLELTIALYKSMGIPEDNVRAISEAMAPIKYVLMRILPSLLAAGLLVVAWLNLLLAKVFLKKEIPLYPALGPLHNWKAPENLVWGVIASALMMVLPAGALKVLGINGMIIFLVIYFFQGMAVISYYFETKKVPFALKALLYSMIVIQQIFVLMIAGLGFFDIWLNFRRLGMDNNSKQNPLAL